MITPTFFDIAAITGLSPVGETYIPDNEEHSSIIDFDVKLASFSKFISHYHTEGDNVSDVEHIAFLTLWLSRYVFCSRSLQVASRFIPLARDLHENRRVCLSELLLVDLYESLRSAVSSLKSHTPKNILLAGPFWLLQLWLNAMFESSLSTADTIVEQDPEIADRIIEGTRLRKLTPNDDKDDFKVLFSNYIMIFSKRHKFEETMAPFASRTHGPSWFTMSLSEAVKSKEIQDIWKAFLLPRLISSRITPAKNQIFLFAYQPNFVSRQFGLCQLIPEPLFQTQSAITSGQTFKAREAKLQQEQYQDFAQFELLPFEPTYFTAKGFLEWWTKFYQSYMFDTLTIQQKLTDAFDVQVHSKKGMFTHAKEIRAFQNYFETTYDPTRLETTVYRASMTLKEKFKEKMSKFKLPSGLSPEDRYRLALEMHPPKFPRLPTSELALAWFPPYPWWLTCKEMFKYKSQKKLKPSETVTWARHWLHNFPGHLRYDLPAISITSNQGTGANAWENPKCFLLSLFLTLYFNCFIFQPSG